MNVEMVDTPEALERLCNRVAAAGRLGIDTEFHNERTYTARLMVVQLAFEDGYAIVDPLKLPDLRPLIQAMSGTTVVGHALSSDLKIFADRFDVVPPRVFDCQVAAAFLGYGMAISLADLVRDVCGIRLKKSQTVSDWSARPFSERQLEYLVDDVAHLLEIQTLLTDRLQQNGRLEWALEECRDLGDISRYRTDARRMYGRIPGANRMSRRELGVLSEIVNFRDRLARERDLPVKYILPDDVVAGLATLRPHHVEDLAQLRRLDAGARRSLGPAIVDAVKRGEALPEASLPEKFSKPLGNARETLVALMSVVVGEIARENGLPASMLAARAALERLAREVPEGREEFDRVLGLSPWRMHLVAEPLWRLLSGAAALRIEGHATGDPRIIVES
ncbi:MAG TPA: HRDC domain-containing protein [Candidatus Baltobacteraceae bacterium]|nr:HRDC domain-containing protein [Candidatus Baltobacteraceae bacterium]